MKLAVLCLLGILIVATLAPVAGQEPPSHERVVGTISTPLDINAHLSQFQSLFAYTRDVVNDVSSQNFTIAQADLAHFNEVADQFKALNGTSSDDVKALDSIKAMREDVSQLVVSSQRFGALDQQQATLVTSDPYGNESTANALEMQQLATNIGGAKTDLDTRSKAIADIVAQHSLHLEDYNDTGGSFSSYMFIVNSRLANVTDLVFQTTNISAQLDRSVAQYGDTISFSGDVHTDQGGVPNVLVNVLIDNQPTAGARTDATGHYNGTYAVDGVSVGTHQASASFNPQGVPYKAAASEAVNFSVQQTPVELMLKFNGGSLAFFNKISLFGTATASGRPVTNAPIVVYVNGNAYSITKTDEDGKYFVEYSQSIPEFVKSLVTPNAATFYALLEPGDRPLSSTQSTTVTSPVFGSTMAMMTGSVFGGYFIVFAAVLLVATPPLYVRRRRRQHFREVLPLPVPTAETAAAPEVPIVASLPSRTAEPAPASEVKAASEPKAASKAELISASSSSAPTAETAAVPEVPDVAGLPHPKPLTERVPAPELGGTLVPGVEVDLPHVIRNARGLFDAGNDAEAIMSLYGAMVSRLVNLRGVVLTTSMTNWEKFSAIASAVPEAHKPAQILTYVDELARYGGEAISQDVFEAAVRALESIGILDNGEEAAEP